MTYDDYKAEVLRILCRGPEIMDACRKFVGGLRCDHAPAVKITGLNENHYEVPEKFVMTMAGSVQVVDDRPYYGRVADVRARIQNRWLVRKMKDYGTALGSARTLVSTCKGTVYFSYHLIMPQASHLAE